jgi:hypothetical protein
MNWLEELDKATDMAETPRHFIWWGGIAAISAIISPNVWQNKSGVYQLRPNLYILLVARSGFGKGLPVFIAKKLVAMTKTTRVISGRSTIEGILQDLSRVKSDGPQLKDSRGFIVSSEFASSLQRNPDALVILTDLYDSHYQEEWKNTLKTSPVETLKNPCVTLFSGSSPAHLEDFLEDANIQGGFIGRTILVQGEHRHRKNALTDDDALEINYDHLAKHLIEMSKISGKMMWSKAGRERYEEWYDLIRDSDVEDKTGTIDRLHDNVCKVAMCISMSKKFDRIIELEDIEESILACHDLVKSSRRLTSGAGKSSMASQVKSVLEIIFRTKELRIRKSDLLNKGMGDFTVAELDQIVETLSAAEVITQTGVKDITYAVTDTGKEVWGRILRGQS